MTYKHEVIFCIVNAGFSEAVMECARQAGAPLNRENSACTRIFTAEKGENTCGTGPQ